LVSVLAIRFSEAREQTASAGAGREAPSFAAWSASSFPGISRWPGTQRMRTAPGLVCGSLGRKGHLRATSWNSSNMDCEDPVDGPKSLVATSRLSRKTQRSVAKRAEGRDKAVLAPVRAAEASASNTSACLPKE